MVALMITRALSVVYSKLHHLPATSMLAPPFILSPTFLVSSSCPIIILTIIIAVLLHHLLTNPHPVLLLDYSCFKPPPHRRSTYELSEYFVRKTGRFTHESQEFMRNIYLKSGLGNDTYGPPFFLSDHPSPTLPLAMDEAREGMFFSVDSLLAKTHLHPSQIDIVVVTSGCFASTPSLSSILVNRYRMRHDVRTFTLTGMGCSSGVVAVDMAAKLVGGRRSRVQYALVVVTENMTMNWYFGGNRSMLVTNCLFRVGCAAAIVTNDYARRREAKFRLVGSLRTHHGADDRAYRAAIQEEDENGNTGISLTKDLIRVAGENLRQHIKILAPRVLPISELINYCRSVVMSTITGGEVKRVEPDFTTAFEHMCIHTGGKAVIERVGAVLRLPDHVTEASRMSLHRFGNTSSSLVFYQLAYLDANGRIKEGDRVWMLAFGTGFKVGSLVWIATKDSRLESDNPWDDSIHRYPLKCW